MTNEILKKIEEMKSCALRLVVKNPHDTLDRIQNDISNGYITACEELADFILSSQKYKCYSTDDCEMRENGNCFIGGTCPHLTKPVTEGDVVRESNESLAKHVFTTREDLKRLAIEFPSEKFYLDFYNEPYKEEEN